MGRPTKRDKFDEITAELREYGVPVTNVVQEHAGLHLNFGLEFAIGNFPIGPRDETAVYAAIYSVGLAVMLQSRMLSHVAKREGWCEKLISLIEQEETRAWNLTPKQDL